MTMLWEIAEAALKRDDNKEFRQKNHMVHARRVRRVSQVRPYDTLLGYGTSEGANKGWDSRGRGRAKKNFEPPSSVVKKDPDDEMKKLHHGAVCSDCGRTVTNGEYSKGESNCCKKDVVPEEEYGR